MLVNYTIHGAFGYSFIVHNQQSRHVSRWRSTLKFFNVQHPINKFGEMLLRRLPKDTAHSTSEKIWGKKHLFKHVAHKFNATARFFKTLKSVLWHILAVLFLSVNTQSSKNSQRRYPRPLNAAFTVGLNQRLVVPRLPRPQRRTPSE